MDSSRLKAAAVLVLAVTALGAASATIDGGSAGGGSPGVGDGQGAGVGDDEESNLVPTSDVQLTSDDGQWFRYLMSALFGLAGIALVLHFFRALVEWEARHWALLGLCVVGLLLVGYGAALGLEQLAEALSGIRGSSGESGGFGGEGGTGLAGSESGTAADLPPVALVAAFAAVLGAGLLLARFARSRSEDASGAAPAEADEDLAPEPATGSGGTAGRRRIASDVPADNEVYRAWLALADAADADPARDTPSAIVDRAVDAGVDRGVAREVTTLFEEVRYGPAEATEDRERRAARALERLGGVDA